MILKQDEFLKKYRINKVDFDNIGMTWDDLMEIYIDYCSIQGELEPILNMVADVLRKQPQVHSIKQRLKNPEHLIEKIIRKCIKNPDRSITVDNYKKEITDLIGIRVIHLFKEDWRMIHEYITSTWELKEPAVANIRVGDNEDAFKKYNCEIKQHPFGYRSVHYLISVKPYKTEMTIELQVRTIFEEGWSEIDHQIRYPYDIDNTIIANYLVMFNRIAGSADEMGSYIRYLHHELSKIKEKHEKQLEAKNQVITELEELIENSKMEAQEKEELRNKISTLAGVLARAATQIDPLIMKKFSDSIMSTISTMPLADQEKEAFNFLLGDSVRNDLQFIDLDEAYMGFLENKEANT